MRVVVTGASGFVGRHVLDALAARSDVEIVAASRRPPDRLPPNARHEPLDLLDATAADVARLAPADTLIHLAWGGLPNYLSRRHFEVEAVAQYRFLRLAVEGGVEALLVAGTCYEYGMVDGELREDMVPAPANPYAFAKAGLLRQLRFLQTDTPFALTWARLFYLWGEGQAPTSLFALLRAAVARGDPTFPMSAGEQLRDYLPVEEAARILVDLAMRREDLGVVNVSSGEPTSVRALVERWIAAHGWSIEPELGRYPYPAHEPLAFWGSAAKRRRSLAG